MGTAIARVRTKRVTASSLRATGTQLVPTGATSAARAAERDDYVLADDEDTVVIDDVELAALLAQAENANARDG